MSEWQPIDTAPTDREVILYWPATGSKRPHGFKHVPMMRIDWASSTPNRRASHWMEKPEPPRSQP